MQIDPQPVQVATIDLGDGLELSSDGTVRKGLRLAASTDVPIRVDLPPTHPLLNQRAVRSLPSGMCDCSIVVEGRLERLTISVKPVELAEVRR